MKKIFIYGDIETLINYANAIEGCGAKPIFSTDIKLACTCDGLLLAGGGDVDPEFYGEKCTASTNIEQKRDIDEIELIKLFTEMRLPILGICRGLQIINVAFGGTLWQHIDTAPTHVWSEETGDKTHDILAEKNSFLSPIYGSKFSTNSAHHQGIKKIADGFSVSAHCSDGIIEAIQCCEKNIYALQFHPERMCFKKKRSDTVDGSKIFNFFLSKC